MSQGNPDHRFMVQALTLARRGLYSAHPNPRVGCVIVQDGQIIGAGWHEHTGGPHAEVGALRVAGEAARGATAYVTLEPCSHHGRTPPCADVLISAGIGRVVAAMIDPAEQVSGKGLERLRQAGIEVVTGVLEDEAQRLNRGFVSRCERGRPWVRLKMAVSLDGRTALENGESQWITGASAREDVHTWRARASAILTGSGTMLADDPSLTARVPGVVARPLRVIADSHWQTPAGAHIFASPGAILIAGLESEQVTDELLKSGAELLKLPGAGDGVDLAALMTELGRRGVNELHTECGAKLAGALVNANLVDELLIYMAPKLMGDRARGMLVLEEIAEMSGIHSFDWTDVTRVGDDLRLTLQPRSELVSAGRP